MKITKNIEVLLIEDHLPDVMLVERALEKSGISSTMHVIHDGEEATNYLLNEENSLPDIILLDINLPKMNGFEILSEIDNQRTINDIPIIILSSSDSGVFKKFSRNFNVAAYNTKPLDVKLMKTVLINSLKQKQA